MFTEQGFKLVDTDAIVKTEVLVDPVIVARLCERFGAAVAPGGVVDRARVADIVFKDRAALTWLEELVHPEVRRRWLARVQAEPAASWIVEVPLLFEKDLGKWFDFVACVACSPGLQLRRLEQRGLTRTLAEERIAQQLPLSRKVELSDFVLSNDGTPEFLRLQVVSLAAQLRSAA